MTFKTWGNVVAIEMGIRSRMILRLLDEVINSKEDYEQLKKQLKQRGNNKIMFCLLDFKAAEPVA
jgi:hypothetical protein